MEYRLERVVSGYHVYQSVWDAVVGENLLCITELGNSSDQYAVAVTRNDIIVGHVPQKFSAVCTLFLRRGGVLTCEITGRRLYSRDLPQGGLEIPCRYIFQGNPIDISKLKKVLAFVFVPNTGTSNDEPVKKRRKIDETLEDPSTQLWIEFGRVHLSVRDKDIIVSGSELNDLILNFAQTLLQHQFSHTCIFGLQSTLLQQAQTISPFPAGRQTLLVIHSQERHHWVAASTINVGGNSINTDDVLIYDSLYTSVDDSTVRLLEKLFGRNVNIKMPSIQKQLGSQDCGLFVIAISVALLHNIDPTKE